MTATMLSMNIDAKRLSRSITGWQRGMSVRLPAVTQENAIYGVNQAVRYAPKLTHALVQAIMPSPGTKKNEWLVLSRMPTRGNPRRRPYHQMMAGLSKRFPTISGKIHSGSPFYMRLAWHDMIKKYPKDMRKAVKSIMNRY